MYIVRRPKVGDVEQIADHSLSMKGQPGGGVKIMLADCRYPGTEVEVFMYAPDVMKLFSALQKATMRP